MWTELSKYVVVWKLDTTTNSKERWEESVLISRDTLLHTVELRFNDPRYNDILDITINIHLSCKSYSKMYGAEPRYDDIPGITMGMSLTERKTFL